MKIDDLKKYNFHDSLLEKVLANENEIVLIIDFCKWQQSDYNEITDKETCMLKLIFPNATCSTQPWKINDDAIISVDFQTIQNKTQITFIVYNDLCENIIDIKICGEDVICEFES
ncbi:MAG: hypothetical protein LUG12_09080 [Erysipelotrichaceae bacterium]|nr:hypothetical protein [Erysipelotrichaceae bacterium]